MLLVPALDPAFYIGYPAKAGGERALGAGGVETEHPGLLSPATAFMSLTFVFIHLKIFS